MLRRSLQLLALGAVAALGTAAPATAGGCCACASACAQPVTYQYVWKRAYVAVPVPVAPTPIYIVNQGPVYTGPGIHTVPQVEEEPQLTYPRRHVHRHHVHQRTVQVERPRIVYRDRVVTRRVSKDPTPRYRPTAKRPFDPRDK